MKNLFSTAIIVEDDDVFKITVNGKPIKTPLQEDILLPTRNLAESVLRELQQQEGGFKPETMPMMRLVCTALDRVNSLRADAIDELLSYGNRDLLCYHADHPVELLQKQQKDWGAILDWLFEFYNVRLNPVTGMVPVEQPSESLLLLRGLFEKCSDMQLAGLLVATQALGSVVLAFALLEQKLNAQVVMDLACLDELYQETQWGADSEALARRRSLLEELEVVELFFQSL